MNSRWEAEQWRCEGNTEFQERNWVGGHSLSWKGGWAVRGKGGKQARTGPEQVTVDVRRRLRDANVDSAS